MNTLLALETATPNGWDALKWIIFAVSAIVLIYLILNGIWKLYNEYKELHYKNTLANLQSLIFGLKETSENFDKIEIEFDKLEEMDQAAANLKDAFYTRFAKIAEKKQRLNIQTESSLKLRVENKLKDINCQLEQVKKDWQKSKDYEERRCLNEKENNLIIQSKALTEVLKIESEVKPEIIKRTRKVEKKLEPTLELHEN